MGKSICVPAHKADNSVRLALIDFPRFIWTTLLRTDRGLSLPSRTRAEKRWTLDWHELSFRPRQLLGRVPAVFETLREMVDGVPELAVSGFRFLESSTPE